ncbi:MAG: ABC transporter substrate-binding protein [Armatimonadota bacterium]|nr:ABC transporter substrate-binding protein [Armatimonadota bacterium]
MARHQSDEYETPKAPLTRRDLLRRSALLAGTGLALEHWGAPILSALAAAPQPVGNLLIVQGVDAESLDPHVTTSGASKGMMWAMYDKLLERGPDMKIIPWLATSYRVVNDTTWEFRLRDNVYFHNGEKFGAEHVRDTIARFKNPGIRNVYAGQLRPVKDVEVVNPLTVRIHTDGPFALLAEVLSLYCEVLPRAITAGDVDPTRRAVGSGPYRFTEWIPGQRMVMDFAERPHFSGQPKLRRLVWRPVPEAATRLVELKTGAAHLITPVDPIQIPELEATKNVEIVTFRQLSSQIVVLNALKVRAFQDARVRQAMNYATDVDALIRTVMRGAAYRLNSAFGPGIPGYDESLRPYPYDPDRARQLLSEAGFGGGFDVTLVTPEGRYLNDRLASEAIAGMWSRVGVRTRVQVMDWSPFVQGVLGKTHDAFFFQQVGVLLDATVSINFDSERKGAAWQGYHNEEANRLIQEAIKTLNATRRNDMYKRLNQIVYRDAPWVFLWNQQGVYALQKRVKGWAAHPDGIIRLGGISLR